LSGFFWRQTPVKPGGAKHVAMRIKGKTSASTLRYMRLSWKKIARVGSKPLDPQNHPEETV
jgi:hypothetical protein